MSYIHKIYDNSASFEMDQGGIASKVDIGLALPEINVSQGAGSTAADQEQHEKHQESLMRKEGQMHEMKISEQPLAKDEQIIKVSAHDGTNELVVHEEEVDDGYNSSNRESKRNSRSTTPVGGPEFDDSPRSLDSKGLRKKGGKGGSFRNSPLHKRKEAAGKKDQAKAAKVVPKAGVAWKGMQGEQM